MIVPMTAAHVEQVTDVHRRSFQGFFLSFLGPRFLRLFYAAGVEYPQGVGYVYVNGSRVLGFVFGTPSPGAFYRFLLKTRWLKFALAASGRALRYPAIIPRLFRAWRYPGQAVQHAESATLMSIAVDPEAQRAGIGAELVRAFVEALRARGVRRVDLTTDRLNNDGVHAFYLRQGFRCERTFVTPEGREMSEYVMTLCAGAQPLPGAREVHDAEASM